MLRKSVIIIIVICMAPLAYSADSPISKGSMMLGGSANFLIQTGEAYQIYEIHLDNYLEDFQFSKTQVSRKLIRQHSHSDLLHHLITL